MRAIIDIKNDAMRRTLLVVTLPIYTIAVLLVAMWMALCETFEEVLDTPAAFRSVWKGRKP